jgi:hypothetical protein
VCRWLARCGRCGARPLCPLRAGRGPDRSRLDAARGAAVSGAAVAAASGRVSTPWWWETVIGGGLRWRRAPARPA